MESSVPERRYDVSSWLLVGMCRKLSDVCRKCACSFSFLCSFSFPRISQFQCLKACIRNACFSCKCLCGTLTEDQRADLLGGIRASQGKQDDPKTTEEETKREDVAAAFVRKILPQLPADCVRFQDQKLYQKPSHLVLAMMTALPGDRQLNEDCVLLMFWTRSMTRSSTSRQKTEAFIIYCCSVRVVLGRRILCRI